MATVWVESWEHGCCGDAFRVGDRVTWPAAGRSLDGLVRLLGADIVGQAVWSIERHNEEVQQVSGTVTCITAVFCQLEEVTEGPDSPFARPAAGTAVLRALEGVERGQHQIDEGGLHDAGYLVELAGLTVIAPGEGDQHQASS